MNWEVCVWRGHQCYLGCFWKEIFFYAKIPVLESLSCVFHLMTFFILITFLFKIVLLLCWETERWSLWLLFFCLQASPLDIYFDSFYTSHKEMIDKRLEEITSAPVQVDGCYSLHCSLLVSQIFGTNCSCFLIFLISETSGNGLQNMGWSRRRALCRPQLGSVHKCGTSKGVFNNLVVFLSCAIGLWEVQWPNG